MLRRQRGFTLLELIVVLVIIGVMTSLAVPSVISGMRQREVRRSVRSLVSAVRLSSASAVSKRARAQLTIRPDDGTYSVSGYDRERELPEFASFGDVEGGRLGEEEEVIFDFHPTGSSSGGVIEVEYDTGSGRQVFVLTISPLLSTVKIHSDS